MGHPSRALLAAVSVVLALGAVPTPPPASAASTPEPTDIVAVTADGSTASMPKTPLGTGEMDIPGAFGAVPSAVSDGLYFVHLNTGGSLERLRFLSVTSGALEETELAYLLVMVGDPPARTVSHTPLGGTGWGTIRLLTHAAQQTGSTSGISTYIDSGRFYGIGADGVLRRYLRTAAQTPAVRSWGTQAGFAGVKAMTLYSTAAGADILLMTTGSGVLSAVTVPTSGPRLAATSTRLRLRTWAGFESLRSVPSATRSSARLVGIDTDTARGYEYIVGSLRGTATVMTTRGPWPEPADDPFYIAYPRLVEAVPPGG